MLTFLEFHDSVVGEIREESARCVLSLCPAYLHRSSGVIGSRPTEGFWQNVRVVIDSPKIEKTDLRLPLWISDGQLSAGDLRCSSIAPTPFLVNGKVVLELLMEDSSRLMIEGDRIEIETYGDPEGSEEIPE